MKRKILVIVFFLVALLILPKAEVLAASNSSSGKLASFVEEALKNNPSIQEASHKWKAAQHTINSVKGLPEPNIHYSYFGESIQTRVGPQEHKYGVSQQIPFPGKLTYKGKVQDKEAQILKEKYEAVQSEVIKDVKFTFYDLYWIDRALEINGEEKKILEKMEKSAQRKYESNLAPQQDVVKLQVELSKIINKMTLLEQGRVSVVAKMNRLLGREEGRVIAATGEVATEKFDRGLDDLLTATKSSRQELTAANLTVEKSDLQRSLARMDYLPDFKLGYEYTDIGGGTTTSPDDGQDAWMGKVSVSIPFWFGKIRSNIQAKEEELKAAEKKREDVEDMIVYEVQDMYSKILAYQDIVALYETALLPQARQAFESYQKGFETSSVSFLDWLDAQRTYLQTRLAYYKSITDYQKSIAMLERITGQTVGGEDEQ